MEYRRALEVTGERSVGAWARRRRRRKVLVAATGLLLTLGAVLIYQALRSRPHDAATSPYAVSAECVTCKTRVAVRATAQARFPMVCAACGERAVWPLWHCLNCGKVFVRTGAAGAPVCPRCGASRVGAVTTQPAGE